LPGLDQPGFGQLDEFHILTLNVKYNDYMRGRMTQAQIQIALPRDAYYQMILTLRELLPPISASAADIARRDHAAIAQVASLCPANAAQAALAAQYVAANAQAMACLRQTRDPTTPPEVALRCTAQAASMMRQSQGAFRLLLRAQGVKPGHRAEEMDGAAWAEHRAEQWMLEALGGESAPVPAGTESENRSTSPGDRNFETDSDTDERVGDAWDGGAEGLAVPAIMDAAAEPGDASGGEGWVAEQAVDPPRAAVMGLDASHDAEQPLGNHDFETDSGFGGAGPGCADAGSVWLRDESHGMVHCRSVRIHETHLGWPRPADRTGAETHSGSRGPDDRGPGHGEVARHGAERWPNPG